MFKMATSKKTTAPKSAEAKVVAPKAEEMTTKVTAAPVEEKKKTVRKPAEKKAETSAAPAPKKAEAPVAVKAEDTKTVKAEAPALTVNVCVQFAGKSYTQTDITNIAKDVWQYDLGKPLADLQSVELYVKPEESMTYYVFNGQEQGSFQI
jgi:hypothetical protein